MLADANESRDWRIFADFAHRLIATAGGRYARESMGVDLEQSLYALDSTTIDRRRGKSNTEIAHRPTSPELS